MCEEKNEEGAYEDSNQQQEPASRPEQQIAVGDMCFVLSEEYDPSLSSSTAEIMQELVDSLTDYILGLVGSEGINPQDGQREVNNNREHHPIILDVFFSFMDGMLEPRRNG